MNIVKSYMTNNPYYRANKRIVVKGLMLHSVGCAQPSAKVFINNWNNDHYTAACVHAFIDATNGTVYETIPHEVRAPHAGGTANDNYIGVEMCEPAQIKYTGQSDKFTVDSKKKATAKKAVERTYKAAVEYFAYLCDKFKLDPMTQIFSHKEGGQKGIASAHTDPQHLWDGLGMGYTMDGFRKEVAEEMEKLKDVTPVQNTASVFKPIVVRVKTSVLRIRKGPGTNFDADGFTGVGAFTIVEIKSGPGSTKGWGKLKSGAGWISMDYTEEIV